MKVMLLCRSVEIGGTERQVVELAKALRRRGHTVIVTAFYDRGALLPELTDNGIQFVTLGKRGRWDVIRLLAKFVNAVCVHRPHVVYSFLPVPNMVALLAKPFGIPVVWGVRTAYFQSGRPLERVLYWLEARLSLFADATICNSLAGMRWAKARGFQRLAVVPNGVDMERFKPGLPRTDAHFHVGWVGRNSPEKDLPTFMEAMRLVQEGDAQVWCSIFDRYTGDMPTVYRSLDLLVLSSIAESLPNVILEAMACGVAVVATDVGDVRRAVGRRGGIVVPPGNPTVLAKAIESMLLYSRNHELRAGRSWSIGNEYSLSALGANTETYLTIVVNHEDWSWS